MDRLLDVAIGIEADRRIELLPNHLCGQRRIVSDI